MLKLEIEICTVGLNALDLVDSAVTGSSVTVIWGDCLVLLSLMVSEGCSAMTLSASGCLNMRPLATGETERTPGILSRICSR